jgi:hypothetical protein
MAAPNPTLWKFTKRYHYLIPFDAKRHCSWYSIVNIVRWMQLQLNALWELQMLEQLFPRDVTWTRDLQYFTTLFQIEPNRGVLYVGKVRTWKEVVVTRVKRVPSWLYLERLGKIKYQDTTAGYPVTKQRFEAATFWIQVYSVTNTPSCSGEFWDFFFCILDFQPAFYSKFPSVLAFGPKVRGCKPGWGRWIFKGDKNPQHAFLRREIKAVTPCCKILRRYFVRQN